MVFKKDFNLGADKESLYRIIGIKPDSTVYSKAESLYPVLLKRAKKLANPKALFEIQKMKASFQIKEAANCDQLIPCLVSLGPELGEEINRLFAEKEYLEAYMLDALTNQMLTRVSTQLHKSIHCVVAEKGMGLTVRISPGDDGVPMHLQKEIIDNLQAQKTLEIEITDGYMLDPVKSLAFFYGTATGMELSSIDHDCSTCERIKCAYRKPEMVKVTVLSEASERMIMAPININLHETLKANGIIVDAPCDGQGYCGKCKVMVVDHPDGATNDERKHLTEEEIKLGMRLACYYKPEKDIQIRIPYISDAGYQIVNHFQRGKQQGCSQVEVKTIHHLAGDLNHQQSLEELIQEQVGEQYSLNLTSLLKLSTTVNEEYHYQGRFSLCGTNRYNVVMRENEVIDILKEDDFGIYGMAIDIGTTTIAIGLYDLYKGVSVNSKALLNSQRKYGADVVSRIKYSVENGIDVLCACIRSDLENMIKEVCEESMIPLEKVYEIVVSGNTVMTHILLGIPVKSLASSPFTTITKKMHHLSGRDLFNNIAPASSITVLPCVSAYVGGDIVAGMLHCGYYHLDKTAILIDLGTNGEIAVIDKNRIYCASTAAGPAFEGASIRDGVGSIPGAICSIEVQDSNIVYTTIGNKRAVGICGSGVIDVVAFLIKHKIINKSGKFITHCDEKEKRVLIAKEAEKEIHFYQKDVREFQLAKSAIRAGLEVVLHKCKLKTDDIDEVYISGGFGNYINIENAIITGLLPREFMDKVVLCGNSSLGGAVAYLNNKKANSLIDEMMERTTYIELSSDQLFSQLFIERMGFD